jgi:hypothetical protein
MKIKEELKGEKKMGRRGASRAAIQLGFWKSVMCRIKE